MMDGRLLESALAYKGGWWTLTMPLVILDMQNTTIMQMKMFLTRLALFNQDDCQWRY